MRLFRYFLIVCIVYSGQIAAVRAQESVVVRMDFSSVQDRTRLQSISPDMNVREEGLSKPRILQQGVIESQPIIIPFGHIEPFLCYAIALRFTESAGENYTLYVQTSQDGYEWSSYKQIAPFGDGEMTAKRLIFQLEYADKSTRFLRYKIILHSTILHKEPVLTECAIQFINPDVTNETAERIILGSRMQNVSPFSISNVTGKPPEHIDVSQTRSPQAGITQTLNRTISRPTFISRSEWNAGPPTGSLSSTVPSHLVVHHSFSPGNDVTNWVAAVRSIYVFHTGTNGWSDIGYNWLIDPQGNIYQGRAWVGDNENTTGAHFCNLNANTMGVCMLGDFNLITPPPAAQNALIRLLAYRASTRSLDVQAQQLHASSNRTLNIISGHRDGCATVCPGNAQYPLLPQYRERTALYLRLPQIERIFFDSLSGFFVNAAIRTTISQPASVSAYFRYRENGVAIPRWDSTPNQTVILGANGVTNITALVPTFISRPLSRYTFQVILNTGDTSITASLNDVVSSVRGQVFQGSFRLLSDDNQQIIAELTPFAQGLALIDVVNAQGRTVYREERRLLAHTLQSIILPMHNQASGMYFVRIQHNGGQSVQAIAITR